MLSSPSVTAWRVLVLGDEAAQRQNVSERLAGDADYRVSQAALGDTEGLQAVKAQQPDAIIVVDAGSPPRLMRAIEDLDSAALDIPIIAWLRSEHRDVANDCLLAGARLALAEPEQYDHLISHLTRLRSLRERSHPAMAHAAVTKHGMVIAVHGAKGGVGKTTIATNLAVALQEAARGRVALVDTDLQAGDVGVALNIVAPGTLTDLLGQSDIDETLLGRVMATHRTGLHVLLAPTDISDSQSIGAEHLTRIIGALARAHDFVVIDTGPQLDHVSIAVMDAADVLLVVTTPEVASLRNTVRLLQLTHRFGYAAGKLQIIVNRANSQGALPMREVEQLLQQPARATIMSDWRLVALNNAGELAVHRRARGELAMVARDLAAGFVRELRQHSPTPPTPAPVTGLWRRRGAPANG